MQQQEAVLESMASLTVQEESGTSVSPSGSASPPCTETAAQLLQSGVLSSGEDSAAELAYESLESMTPKKSPLQGSQILNTPSLKATGTAKKGTALTVELLRMRFCSFCEELFFG